MNDASGIAGRSYSEFAAQWAEMRYALRDFPVDSDSLRAPAAYRPTPVYLATSDVRRGEAIAGHADGWQTFLTDDRAEFGRQYGRVCDIRGGATQVDVREVIRFADLGADREVDLGFGVLVAPADVAADRGVVGLVVGVVAAVEDEVPQRRELAPDPVRPAEPT